MAFRPYMTQAMDRATRLSKLYGVLLIVLSVIADALLLMTRQNDPTLIRLLIFNTLVNGLPGALLWLLSSRMDRVELWSFIAVASLSVILVLQFLFSIMGGAGLVVLGASLLLRLPMIHLIAAIMNAMPQVMDGYRGYRREKRMISRGFDPIMAKTQTQKTAPPPPATTLRRRV